MWSVKGRNSDECSMRERVSMECGEEEVMSVRNKT